MKGKKIPFLKGVEATLEDLMRIQENIDTIPQLGNDREIIKAAINTIIVLVHLIREKTFSLYRFKQMLFGARTEKTKNVLQNRNKMKEKQQSETDPAEKSDETTVSKDQEKKKRKGHGRNGADSYTGAQKQWVPHAALQPGDRCPECEKGKVYRKKLPGTFIHLVGQPPVNATIFEQEKLRCNLCGETFSAELPEEAKKKNDETAASMITLLKYGYGVPFHRLEKLQQSLGIPLPSSTQWDIEEKFANKAYPAFEELKRQGAQGDIVYNDDTIMKILACMKENEEPESGDTKKGRTGMFTTGIISEKDGRKIALFFTGRNHAGENMERVLKHRRPDRGPPIQMCDALARNVPKDVQTILSNSNTHARRKFVEIAWCYPEECAYVVETYRIVYKNDVFTKELDMSPEKRLWFHQENSKSVMDDLNRWLHEQMDTEKVEPNSSLGKAIQYMINHWNELTQFLKTPGAPLDSNIVERALKMAITNRKNAYFYKTEHGAYIGDLFMSLIHSCNLNGVNPFDYLTQLQKHAKKVRRNPSAWMPWNYQETVQALAA